MTTLLLYFLLASTGLYTFFRPWLGVVAYYVLSIFYPQIIWPWIFSGIRTSFIVSLVTILVFFKDIVFQGLNFSQFKSRQSLYIIFLWLSIINSYFNCPYGPNENEWYMYNSKYILSTFNKIFFFYFISIYLIKTKNHLHMLLITLLGSVLYFTYFANMTALTGQFYGRLAGPGTGGVYSDENVFAMTFVVAVPLFFFMGNYYKNRILKYGLWIAIPFAWHGVFLTGSLGGLISLGVVMVFVAFRSKQKLIIGVLPLIFVITFMWQGGGYLKDKALGTEGGVSRVGTAQTRFDSWSAGFKMIREHPITGVGPGNFLRVYSDFASTRPFVAHNTFIQFAADTGIVSGIVYLLLGWSFLSSYYSQRKYNNENFDPFLLAAKESITGAAIGFYTCAAFLNLATYEIFYFLLVTKAVLDRLNSEYILNKISIQPENLT